MKNNILRSKTVTLILATIISGLIIWLALLKPELGRLKQAAADLAEANNEITTQQNKKLFVAQAESQFISIQQDLIHLRAAIPAESESGILVSEIQSLAQNTGVGIESLSTETKLKVVPKKTNAKSASANSDNSNDTATASSKTKSTFSESLLSKYNGLIVTIRVRSSYDSLRRFLSGLTALDRLAVVDAISVNLDQQDPNTLESNVTFYAYWHPTTK